MADKKISELDLALLINNDAVFPMSQDNAGEPTTFKVGITQLGTEIAEDMTFSNLQTASKKLVGAINELLSLGSPIIIGTTAPISSQGANGNLYIQYTAGTGGADDEVDGIFVKINGAWCEIQTGGGGTTDYEDLSNKPQVNSVELVGDKSLDDLGIMPASLSKTVSGSIAHITDGADNIPVKSLTSEIVAVETGTGEKSPENPYTISGFDSGIVPVCGKNFRNNSFKIGYYGNSGWVNNQQVVSTDGILLKSGTYIISCPSVSNKSLYIVKLTTPTSGKQGETPYLSSRVITIASDGYYAIQFNINSVISQAELDTINNTCQLEVGDTATTYEAYNGNTYTFAFGQTVYGGHFDNKGNLVVTHILGELVAKSKNGNYFRATLSELGLPNIYDRNADLLCDRYAVADVTTTTSNNNQITVYGDVGDPYAIRWVDLDYINADVETYNTAMANNKPKICYRLANPITLEIESQDIPTLLECNIFSNCGDVEVDYYTDKADDIVEVVKATVSTNWTTLGTLTESGTPLDISGYSELLIYPKINGTTYFNSYFVDVSELSNATAIHFSIYQDSTHSYMGALDYSSNTINWRKVLIAGWTHCDCIVKAR